MRDNAINEAVCRDVLGWVWQESTDGHGQPSPIAKTFFAWWKDGRTMNTPDFCNDWAAFGVLWEALVRAGEEPTLATSSTERGGGFAFLKRRFGGIHDPDPRRALALAALKAHGVEAS